MNAPRWSHEGKGWPNATASRFVEAGGLRWHVQVMGAGPVVLLLHGTGAATHSWRDLAPLLATDFTVVAPDLPGHGFTSALRTATPVGVATAVAALTEALGLRPVLTIGHSVGAAIAITMADRRLARPQAIVSLGGALLPFPGMAGKLFPQLARVLFLNPFAPALMSASARLQGGVTALLHRWTGSRIEPRGVALYERLFRTPGHVAGALALMANWDLNGVEAALPGLDLPVLLLHGLDDATIPPATARAVAGRLPHATLALLPNLGHLAHEEAPADHARRITDFARICAILPAELQP